MLTRKSVILAKEETTYGTDAVPTVALNALLVSDVDVKVNGDPVRRPFLRPTLGKMPFIRGSKWAEVTFKTELKGTGLTDGSVPTTFGWEGCLFQACGMKEIAGQGVEAFGTLTVTALPSADLEIEVGGVVFAFKASASSETEITIGATALACATNIKSKINAHSTVGLLVSARLTYSSPNKAVIAVTALQEGTEGNAITFENTDSVAGLAFLPAEGTLGGASDTALVYSPLSQAYASGVATITGLATLDETFTIDDQVFTVKASRASAGQVARGADFEAFADNMVVAVNTDLAGTVLATKTFVSATKALVRVTSVLPGSSADSMVFTESLTDTTFNGSGTLIYKDVPSVTLHCFKDGILHKVTGARGSFKIEAVVDGFASVTWSFMGIYNTPVDQTPGVCTFSSVSPPRCLGIGLALGNSFEPVATKIDLDYGASVTPRKSINSATGIVGFNITDRNPKGSLDPESELEATYPFWSQWEEATDFPITMQLGTVAGNRVKIDTPKAQFDTLTYADRDGTLTYDTPFSLAETDGDDELTITIY